MRRSSVAGAEAVQTTREDTSDLTFSAIQATRLTGCSISQVRYWDRIGLVRPTASAATSPATPPAKGSPPRTTAYTFRDLVALRMVRSLLDAGLPFQRVRKAVQGLDLSPGELTGLRLVTDGSNVYACREDGEVLDALRHGQLALFVSVDAVAADVEAEVHSYRRDRDAFVRSLRSEGDPATGC